MDLRRPARHAQLIATGTLTRHDVVDGRLRPVLPGVSIDRAVDVTMAVRAAAALLLHPGAVVLGAAAAALCGVELEPPEPVVDLAIGPSGRRAVPGIRVHRIDPPTDEVTFHDRGLRGTTPARTAYDLARWLSRADAVTALDALCRGTGLEVDAVRAVAAAHPGDRDVRAVEPVLAWVDPRSPDEAQSRRRVRLLARGVPRPLVDHRLLDREGRVVARLALAWPDARTGLSGWAGDARAAKEIGWEVIETGVAGPVDGLVRWLLHSRERWDPPPRMGMPRPLRLPPPPEPDGRCDGGLSRLVAT